MSMFESGILQGPSVRGSMMNFIQVPFVKQFALGSVSRLRLAPKELISARQFLHINVISFGACSAQKVPSLC